MSSVWRSLNKITPGKNKIDKTNFHGILREIVEKIYFKVE